ncbi:MAG TPA: hypothetical protein VM265_08140 [Sphingomicrobium sp.]|nr:hypothetical protein [Sphingomicrobium sp.]
MRPRGRHIDSDTARGVGAALNQALLLDQAGDEQFERLLEQLKAVPSRPPGTGSPPATR